jgi:hypothetical protein
MTQDRSLQSVASLVDDYIRVGVAQYEAEREDNLAKFNRLVDSIIAIEAELRHRPGDERRALLSLYGPETARQNIQVRLNAAHATIAIDPLRARAELEAIRTSKHMPQALHAGMSISNLDKGFWKPT